MPNIKSAIKRVKTSEKRRLQNAAHKSTTRTAVKAVENAIAANDANVNELLRVAIKQLDKASAKGLIHKNTVARQKSRLTKKVNTLSS